MSTGLGLITILGCLQEGEKVAGLDPRNWSMNTICPTTYFIDKFAKYPKDIPLKHFSAESLRSYASNVHPDVIAKMNEWKMRLDPIPEGGPTAIYMISQLREMMDWLEAGQRVTRQWPEFILNKGVRFLGVGRGCTAGMVVEISVKGGDKVYLYRHDQPMEDGLDLLQFVMESIEMEMWNYYSPRPYFGVQIPCVSADLESDLSWILGMENDGYTITYAQQKILFGMNELGFAVREETAMSMERCLQEESKPYILSPNGESFLFWRRRPGVFAPVSLFQFTKEDFKDPGDLSKIVE